MPDPAHFLANFQRAVALLNANRPHDAVAFAQAAITADPANFLGYRILAQCWNAIPSQRAKSIGAIDRAIGLAPGNSQLHGLKGWFYVCLRNFRRAKRAADQGLALDPNCIQSLNALANAHTKLRQWRAAETACRRILALNPEDGAALNLLAQALRHLGRYQESREAVDRLLAQMPNSAFGHANAGHAALLAGDHLRANQHFLESLRLDPHFDFARKGLLMSLQARSWMVRLNLRIGYAVNRPLTFLNAIAGIALIAALFTGAIYAALVLNRLRPNLGKDIFSTVFLGALFYVYLCVLVRLMGNFLLLFDPLGRHALTREEKIKACIPVAIFGFVLGVVTKAGDYRVALILLGCFGLLALFIQAPLWYDRRQRRRLETAA